jgi:PAS domain S-box-containing protein
MTELDYREALYSLGDGIVAADTTNNIVYVNKAAEQLLGWPDGSLVGQPLTVIQPRRLRNVHLEGFHRYLRTREPRLLAGATVRVPALRRDGTEIDIELTLSAQVTAGGQEIFVGSLRDLGQRIELERQLLVTNYLRATAQVAAQLAPLVDLDHASQLVVEALVAHFDASGAELWVREPATGDLRLAATAGGSASRSARAAVGGVPPEVDKVAHTQQGLFTDDRAEGTGFEPHLDRSTGGRVRWRAAAGRDRRPARRTREPPPDPPAKRSS